MNFQSEASFEVLFKTYYSGLHAYALRYVDDPAQADEVVQEVFAQLWEKRSTINIQSSLKSYLFRAVHNHCLNLIKHQKVRETYRTHVEANRAEFQVDETDSMIEVDIKESIMEGIASLPKQCAKVFRMNRLEGFKYREIAEKLGISQKTVEAQMAKAMRRMRVYLKDHLPLLLLIMADFFR
ncbi:MAG: RNA polymerase sigma-70 factor [Bacteroidota bacterium]